MEDTSEADLLIFFLGFGWILAGPLVPCAEFLKVGSGLVALELEVDEVELPVELGCLPLLRLMKAAGGIADPCGAPKVIGSVSPDLGLEASSGFLAASALFASFIA